MTSKQEASACCWAADCPREAWRIRKSPLTEISEQALQLHATNERVCGRTQQRTTGAVRDAGWHRDIAWVQGCVVRSVRDNQADRRIAKGNVDVEAVLMSFVSYCGKYRKALDTVKKRNGRSTETTTPTIINSKNRTDDKPAKGKGRDRADVGRERVDEKDTRKDIKVVTCGEAASSLSAVREEMHMTKRQMATLLRTTEQNYARYERGEVTLPVRHVLALSTWAQLPLDAAAILSAAHAASQMNASAADCEDAVYGAWQSRNDVIGRSISVARPTRMRASDAGPEVREEGSTPGKIEGNWRDCFRLVDGLAADEPRRFSNLCHDDEDEE